METLEGKRSTLSYFLEGYKDGLPVLIGYFSTALAFGLLCRTSALSFVQSVLISVTNFSGSGQFLMMNLYNGGSALSQIILSVLFINLRYCFMATSIYTSLEDRKPVFKRIIVGFGTTDEVFAISTLKSHALKYPYMFGLILSSYTGWVSGTALGFLLGNFLTPTMQKASVITVYAMFASLLGSETRKNTKALLVLFVSGGLNTILILCLGLSTGVSFIVSMISAMVFGFYIYKDEEVFGE